MDCDLNEIMSPVPMDEEKCGASCGLSGKAACLPPRPKQLSRPAHGTPPLPWLDMPLELAQPSSPTPLFCPLSRMLSVDYLCCCLPLINTGIYFILLEQLVRSASDCTP